MYRGSELIVIYDGECRFCRSTLTWLEKKMQVRALPFQSTDLTGYGLTSQQCSVQVYVICADITYAGAAAVGFLLQARGNTFSSRLITSSGGIGRFGYRWVASHRNHLLVRVFTVMLDKSNAKHRSGQK